MWILGDHGADGQDICVHPDPAEGDQGSAIQFGMVCDVEAGVMWLAPGRSCSTEFHEHPLASCSPADRSHLSCGVLPTPTATRMVGGST